MRLRRPGLTQQVLATGSRNQLACYASAETVMGVSRAEFCLCKWGDPQGDETLKGLKRNGSKEEFAADLAYCASYGHEEWREATARAFLVLSIDARAEYLFDNAR